MKFPTLFRAALLCAVLCSPSLRAADDTFKVCWYNVENWGPTDRFVAGKKVKDTMKPESEQAAVMAMLKKQNPDVFACCEVLLDATDPEKNAKLLHERLKAAGMDFKEMRTVRGQDERGSLVLFSKFPISKFEALNKDEFKMTKAAGKGTNDPAGEVTMRVSRGILHAVIQVNDKYSFDLFTAHLKSKRAASEFDDDVSHEKGDTIIRRNEALILRNYIVQTYKANPQANILVTGDLNDTMKYPAIRSVVGNKSAEVQMYVLPQRDYLGDRWTHYFIPDVEYAKIDYMIASEGMAREFVQDKSGVYRERPEDGPELKWAAGTDHRMLFATFQATDKPEPYVPKRDPDAEE